MEKNLWIIYNLRRNEPKSKSIHCMSWAHKSSNDFWEHRHIVWPEEWRRGSGKDQVDRSTLSQSHGRKLQVILNAKWAQVPTWATTTSVCFSCIFSTRVRVWHGNFCNEVIDKVDPNPNPNPNPATSICRTICKCYFVMQLVNSMQATRQSANRQSQQWQPNRVATRRFSQPVKCIRRCCNANAKHQCKKSPWFQRKAILAIPIIRYIFQKCITTLSHNNLENLEVRSVCR